jgi:Domain of unknown function (DUF4249)
MKNCLQIIAVLLWIIVDFCACVQTYTPAPIQANDNYLVVEGNLILGRDSTVITLSRSQNLSDSNAFTPEPNAQVSVLAPNGSSIPLIEKANGVYWSPGLNLNLNDQYQLKIVTSNGKEYLTDTLVPKSTPLIDSVYWRQDNTGVNIYLDTHDALNDTRYYLWNFTETWEHNAAYNAELELVNGQLTQRSPSQQIYTCWASMNSTDILVGNSVNLNQDVIARQLITLIPPGSIKMSVLYSILVRQYAISQQAYEYWQNLKINTEQLGSIFDAQPSQLTGNIHCVSNPNEPVLGYISASSETSERIFVNRYDLIWIYYPPQCYLNLYTEDLLAKVLNDSLHVVLISEMGAGLYGVTSVACGDCRYDGGGSNSKPDFWP